MFDFGAQEPVQAQRNDQLIDETLFVQDKSVASGNPLQAYV